MDDDELINLKDEEFQKWIESALFDCFDKMKPKGMLIATLDEKNQIGIAHFHAGIDDRRLIAHAILDIATLEVIENNKEGDDDG